MKIEEKITKLLSVTTRLSKILKQENELLAASARANGIKPLQEQKIALSNAYEQPRPSFAGSSDFFWAFA